MEAYRLTEVNNYIKQVIAANFSDSLWVKAEISQINHSRGHFYLDLIEKDENSDEVIARMSAAIWMRSYLFIKKKLGKLADQILIDGTSIQCKVKIDFHEKYGLKFTIEDIDASYTFGQLELERQKTIEKLQEEKLISKNAIETDLPLVIQSIAIISSETAAGLQDFQKQLANNSYAYKFETKLFPSSVQGNKVEKEILDQLESVRKLSSDFDCVVIVRGGGSKLDLARFDSYEIAKFVANFPIPVISGIGHDIDQNVIELVVYNALKTPTAVANYIIDHNLHFESKISDLYQGIIYYSKNKIDRELERNKQYHEFMHIASKRNLDQSGHQLILLKKDLKHKLFKNIQQQNHFLDQLEQQITYSNPINLLNKGYTLAFHNKKIIKSMTEISIGDQINIQFADGQILSEVIEKIKNKSK